MKKKDKEKIEALELRVEKTESLLHDLIDYCERTGLLERDPVNYRDWEDKLRELKHEERQQEDIRKAKDVLEHYKYIVVKDESEIDAAKLKKWVSNNSE